MTKIIARAVSISSDVRVTGDVLPRRGNVTDITTVLIRVMN